MKTTRKFLENAYCMWLYACVIAMLVNTINCVDTNYITALDLLGFIYSILMMVSNLHLGTLYNRYREELERGL